jgi:hypothetical protein
LRNPFQEDKHSVQEESSDASSKFSTNEQIDERDRNNFLAQHHLSS